MLKSAKGDFNEGNAALFGNTASKNVHAMHYFHCVGQLLEKFPFGSHMT